MQGEEARPLRAGESRAHEALGLRDLRAPGLSLHPRAAPDAVAAGLAQHLADALGRDHGGALTAVDRRDFAAARVWAEGGRPRYPRVPGAVQVDHRTSRFGLRGPCSDRTPRGRLPVCGRPTPRIPVLRCGCGAMVRGSLSRESNRPLHARRCAGGAGLLRAGAARAPRLAGLVHVPPHHREPRGRPRVDHEARGETVDGELRACLLDRPIENLVFGRHDGEALGINYPFRTGAPPEEEASVELHDDVGSLLDAIGAGESEPEPTSRPPETE